MDEKMEEFQGLEEMFNDIDSSEDNDLKPVEGMDMESIDFNDEFDENDEYDDDDDEIEEDEPLTDEEFSATMSFDDYEFDTIAFSDN